MSVLIGGLIGCRRWGNRQRFIRPKSITEGDQGESCKERDARRGNLGLKVNSLVPMSRVIIRREQNAEKLSGLINEKITSGGCNYDTNNSSLFMDNYSKFLSFRFGTFIFLVLGAMIIFFIYYKVHNLF
ncbi:hypothetical protein POVWA2_072420 [Plasmodium ovale wallikeri]|uniref:Uncharacterized protein n=1 Tax=Plasmodium ovale wallikeri TaxID=864142 RepID=A0A1A9AFX1_PLAOA|nr:hypothetical protein POVWA1_070130 [Plasmodium ovale wallikeri]SBT56251.1 hypothetical protein POVWA2_072420 [Plasmodium ovale wallikeri]